MVKLTAVLQPARPEDAMMHEVNDVEVEGDLRNHLGLSMIGHKCLRFLQFNHYDMFKTKHTVRILRLFGVGNRMEPVLREVLNERLGILSRDDQKQVVGFAGHWKGHIDGIGQMLETSKFYQFLGDIFLEEFKTHNDKSFGDLKKNKVKASKPIHYGQMMSYMGYLNLKRALYIAYNKNTSEIYLEIVEFNQDEFNELKRKEAEVILADTLLPRIGNDSPMWFECKLCPVSKICFGKEKPKQSCKNCKHVDILDGGVWKCTVHDKNLEDYTPCHEHELMEMLCIS